VRAPPSRARSTARASPMARISTKATREVPTLSQPSSGNALSPSSSATKRTSRSCSEPRLAPL
jgi:hypothetical protein